MKVGKLIKLLQQYDKNKHVYFQASHADDDGVPIYPVEKVVQHDFTETIEDGHLRGQTVGVVLEYEIKPKRGKNNVCEHCLFYLTCVSNNRDKLVCKHYDDGQ